MVNKYVIIFLLFIVSLFLNSCTEHAISDNDSDKILLIKRETTVEDEIEAVKAEERVLKDQQNDGYKMFYGTWKYSEVVSQHLRLGGDEGYEDLIGQIVTYHPDFFQGSGEKFYDPTYFMEIHPLDKEGYTPFFPEQIGGDIQSLLPDTDLFIVVNVVNDSVKLDLGYNGFCIIVKDDTTLYAFDYNCIYKLTRESYIDDYEPSEDPVYRER